MAARDAVRAEAADELAREVLRVGGAAAVPERVEPAAARVRLHPRSACATNSTPAGSSASIRASDVAVLGDCVSPGVSGNDAVQRRSPARSADDAPDHGHPETGADDVHVVARPVSSPRLAPPLAQRAEAAARRCSTRRRRSRRAAARRGSRSRLSPLRQGPRSSHPRERARRDHLFSPPPPPGRRVATLFSPGSPTSAARSAIEVPETYASRQPSLPSPRQRRPCQSTVTCPNSLPLPSAPR